MAHAQGFRQSFSVLSILANSLTAGSLFTYPIFSSSLQSQLNFSIKQVSGTASIAILTQYLSAGLWGSLADTLGSARVSLVAGILFFFGYSTLSYLLLRSTVEEPQPTNAFQYQNYSSPSAGFGTWIQVTTAYSVCGAATAASYFSAITASTRIFGERKPGLSVAGPSSMFGLSPLLLSFLGVKCFSSPDGSFNSSGYLAFLAILTLIVNLVGSIGLPRKDELTNVLSSYDPDERAPLLQTSPALPNHSLHPKPAARAERDPEGILSFLASPTVWFLGMAALLSVGPAEMTIASIGAVADAKNPGLGTAFKARQVQLISITNTFSRLLSGWLSDRFCHASWGSRLVIWGYACFFYAIACFSVAINGGIVWVLSAVTGSCYGVVCTLAPSLVATVWPIKFFGRNYGVISYFFATGSFLFTFLFGVLFEPNDSNSIGKIYEISGLFELTSICLMVVLYRKYWVHGIP
ncbi:putative monocarboxylate transporter mch1 [Puccinia graminis f. sp. tritici]|uniref:Putative monocarboxylate transporter mch1 n=1 Tax=Puccinia graminis f. sp. tritici TaxID=56615 RepID=A0A5B0PK48_PUCGR|nr:putative monocarboxylate transporter mch1 [Puccinia graminis f. sp. tritici]